tara:strand:- start:1878 stop:2084 length:207 start_codon:yes stop_codon:yes gene_type:complete
MGRLNTDLGFTIRKWHRYLLTHFIGEKNMKGRDLFEGFDNIIFEDDNINWKELIEDIDNDIKQNKEKK